MATVSRLKRLDSLVDMPLYRFTRVLAQAGSLVVRVCEGRFGITRREWRLISLLEPADGMTPTELARRAGLDKARTSRAIGSMVDKQLLVRIQRPSDRRHAQVMLTDKARSIHAELLPLARQINRELLDVLDDAELDWLDGVLDRLQARAEEMVTAHDAELPRTQRRIGGQARHLAGDGVKRKG